MSATTQTAPPESNEFHLTVLGRTIEHLGTQMYKHRAPAVAELVANCWDAGAKNVWITIPDAHAYERTISAICILDDGEGMSPRDIQDNYLVIGRNRRGTMGDESHARKVMGRKGIGKLAGFGLAEEMTVTSWTEATEPVRFTMSLLKVTCAPGDTERIKFPWIYVGRERDWTRSGTQIRLEKLKHSSALDETSLRETLSRRFLRTTRGEMRIWVNDVLLEEPDIPTGKVFPPDGGYLEATLTNGKLVKYRYLFANEIIRSKELQGFAVYARQRTAQAPPFFFNVETTASGQHSTRYISGEVVADFIDEGTDAESDVTSTDRQELDWEKEGLKELYQWGQELSRTALRECADFKGNEFENWVLADGDFTKRLALLDKPSAGQVSKFLKILGQASTKDDPRTKDLAGALIRAYEFRNFFDVVHEIEKAEENPEDLVHILGKLTDWKVLESRAILEIIQGRVGIVRKLQRMIINDKPETASKLDYDNLHDLLAGFPWIFDPKWQVFVEERTVGKQLREWAVKDCPEDVEKKRVDFLAFDRAGTELLIVELKRPGHAVTLGELQRLEQYQVALMAAHPNCKRVLVYGGKIDIPDKKWEEQKAASDFQAMTWAEMLERTLAFYSHYEAVLTGNSGDGGFKTKETEVADARRVISSDCAHRAQEARAIGLGDDSA